MESVIPIPGVGYNFNPSTPPPFVQATGIINSLKSLYWVDGGMLVGVYSNSTINYLFDGFPRTVDRTTAIAITNTSSANVQYLSNIVCAPENLTITNNQFLTSLSGIGFWSLATSATWPGLKRLVMANNPRLTQPGFAPLGPILGCGTSPLPAVAVSVSTGNCTFTDVASLCSFITNSSVVCSTPAATIRTPVP